MLPLNAATADLLRDEWLKPPDPPKAHYYCDECGEAIYDCFYTIDGETLCESCKDDYIEDAMHFVEDDL